MHRHPFYIGTHARIRARFMVLETLYAGTKVGTGFSAHNVLFSFGAVHCFVDAAKLMLQSGVRQGEMG